jgi:hypothetical protein
MTNAPAGNSPEDAQTKVVEERAANEDPKGPAPSLVEQGTSGTSATDREQKRETYRFKMDMAVGVAAVIATLVVGWQSCLMKTANDMANKALDESRRQAAKAAADAIESDKQTRAALDLASRNAASVERTATAAERSLVLARENAHREQRPWVVVESMNYQGLDAPLQIVGVVLNNVGRTPAIKVGVRKAFAIGAGEVPDQPLDLTSRMQWQATIGPGVSVTAAVTIEKLSAEQLTAVKSGTTKMYVLGRVEYAEALERDEAHYTNFCAFYVVEINKWRSCTKYNDQN